MHGFGVSGNVYQSLKLISIGSEVLNVTLSNYATIKNYYGGRNTIAHGGAWQAQFFVPNVAQTMNDLLQRFATS